MASRLAQSVGHLTRKSGVLGSIPGLATYFRSTFSRRAVVSYWGKYVHKVLVNRLGGISLPRKSVVRLTDRPDMTLDVYRGRKTTMQQQQCMYGKVLNPIALRKAKIVYNFGLSQCNRLKLWDKKRIKFSIWDK